MRERRADAVQRELQQDCDGDGGRQPGGVQRGEQQLCGVRERECGRGHAECVV